MSKKICKALPSATVGINQLFGFLHISYELYKLDSNAKSMKATGGIDNAELAIFIKRKVELFFGITPQAIEGEYLLM
jgi:hypothetical protein